ncbi:hypothetical protein QAD02_017789 [Eretmocerus hayati]|uniref:Uncharacterized protein n=1 Tax=Eretmocerus hayati TaxID=131215 RepID=A0ACC2PF83_9HYME|nr:hypothetical protein QAD02_017789 [Eretmocerus hayati]
MLAVLPVHKNRRSDSVFTDDNFTRVPQTAFSSLKLYELAHASILVNQKLTEGSDHGGRHFKTEIHEHDRASGHYNIHSPQSSVNVRYVADQSGYHPSVEYNHSDDHSRASATLTFGKVAEEITKTEKSDSPSPVIERRLIQAVEQYQTTEQTSDLPPFLRDVGSKQEPRLTPSSLGLIISSSTITNEKQSDESSFKSGSEEDQPVVENDGSFGQRLQGNNQFVQYTTTPNPVTIQSEFSTSATRSGRYFRMKQQQKANKPYLPDIIPGLSAYSSTPSTSLDTSFTPNSIDFESDRSQKYQNNGIPDSLGLQSYTPSTSPIFATNNPFLVNYVSRGVPLNISRKSSTSVEDHGRREYGFLKPIVVADTTEDRPFQYSTTFECEDDVTTNTPDLFGSAEKTLDKTSSHVLNSIQAGVSLVNAGEAHLIASTNEIQPAPVKEEVEEAYQIDNSPVQLSNMLGMQRNKYVPVRPVFHGKKDLLKEQAQRDESVEIQKSVELFHSSPVHEIHYPEQAVQTQGDSLLITVNNGLNSLQLRDNDANPHGDNDSQPKDSVTIQPVYVVPPATYILEGSSSTSSDHEQDKIPQSSSNENQNSPLIKAEELENSSKNQAYQIPQDNSKTVPGIVYAENSNNHPSQDVAQKKAPLSIEHIVESRLPVPPSYPYTLGVPAPHSVLPHLQKVHTKRIHIPPSFLDRKQNPHLLHGIPDKHLYIPIAAGAVPPIPQPYPLESEKSIDRKVPHLNGAPKFVEKPSTIHAPYGVHYGVSYQQIMKPQNSGLYSQWPKRSTHTYALPAPLIHGFSSSNDALITKQNELNRKLNHTQSLRGSAHDWPVHSLSYGKTNIPKLVHDNHLTHSHHLPNVYLDRRHSPIFRTNEPERTASLGQIPNLQHVHRQNGFPSKILGPVPPHVVERRHNPRRGRSHELAKYPPKGNFRQSKVEYGFKPPLVPSVQYDEDTASKVES